MMPVGEVRNPVQEDLCGGSTEHPTQNDPPKSSLSGTSMRKVHVTGSDRTRNDVARVKIILVTGRWSKTGASPAWGVP
jgi:hypothetical protein